MPIFFERIMILFLLFISTNNKPCGIINLFEGEYILDQSDLLKTRQNLEEQINGKEMTIYGWMKIDNDVKKQIPLLNLKMIKNKNDDLFNNIISITYKETFFLIKYLEEEKKTIEKKFFFKIQNQIWFFIGLSYDYGFGRLNFFVSDLLMQKNEKYYLNFQTFFIGKSFELDIGCIPNDKINKKTLLETCMIGFSKNFNYIFEYFENMENLYLIGNGKNTNVNFIFDIINGNKIYSNNNQEENFFIFEQISKQRKIFQFKGNEKVYTDWVFEKNVEDVKSPGLYIVFSFKEILIDNFLLFSIETENDIKINFFLEKIESERKLKIEIEKFGYLYIFPKVFFQNFIQKISISFINIKNDLLFLLQDNKKKYQLSNKLSAFKLGKKSKVIFFDNKILKDGLINIYQISFFSNSSGIIYNKIKNNVSTHNLRCNQKCELYSSIVFNKSTCLECSQNFIFLSQISKCIDFCPKSSFNRENRCFKCETEKCEKELDQNFFNFRRKNSNQFLISTKNYPNYNIYKNNTFDIKVDDNLLDDKNYEKIKNNEFSVIYKINKVIDDKEVQFIYKDLLIDDGNKNILQNQNHVFKPLNNKSENNLKVEAKKNKEIKLFEEGKIEKFTEDLKQNVEKKGVKSLLPKIVDYKQNANIDNFFKVLAKVIYYFVIVTFILGLIRLFMYFNYNNNNTFFYQKWMQSMLMAQYIVFTILYNFSLPYNLYTFLLNYFKISIKWQSFFTSIIKDEYISYNFQKNFFIKILPKLWRLKIHTHFMINMIFILLFHLGILLIFVFFCFIYLCVRKSIKQKKITTFNLYIKNIVKNSFFKIVFSCFLIFLVEILLFGFYSLSITFRIHFSHIIFFISFALSVTYIFFSIFFLLVILNKSFIKKNTKNYSFVIYGLAFSQNQQLYQFYQYIHYFFFSLLLIVSGKNGLIQIIVNLIILLIFLLYLIFGRPPLKNFFKFDQIFVYLLLFLAIIFLFLLSIDEEYSFISEDQRYIFGIVIVILFAFILIYNSLVVIIAFFFEILNYWKYNRYERQLEANENLHYNDNRNRNRIISDRNNNIFINDNVNDQENINNEVSQNFDNFPNQENNNTNTNGLNNQNYYNIRNPNFSKRILEVKKNEIPENNGENKNLIDDDKNEDEILLKDLNEEKKFILEERLKKNQFNSKNKSQNIRQRLKSFKKLNNLKKKTEDRNFEFKDSSMIQKEDSWDLNDVDYSLLDINKDFECFADKVLRSDNKLEDNK